MARTTFYQKNYVGWPAIPTKEFYNANSLYWKERASEVSRRLVALIGQEAYEKIIDDSVELSWKGYYELFNAMVKAAQAEPEEPHSFLKACHCGYGDCPICSGHQYDPDW